jgi:hypothetical protein
MNVFQNLGRIFLTGSSFSNTLEQGYLSPTVSLEYCRVVGLIPRPWIKILQLKVTVYFQSTGWRYRDCPAYNLNCPTDSLSELAMFDNSRLAASISSAP